MATAIIRAVDYCCGREHRSNRKRHGELFRGRQHRRSARRINRRCIRRRRRNGFPNHAGSGQQLLLHTFFHCGKFPNLLRAPEHSRSQRRNRLARGWPLRIQRSLPSLREIPELETAPLTSRSLQTQAADAPRISPLEIRSDHRRISPRLRLAHSHAASRSLRPRQIFLLPAASARSALVGSYSFCVFSSQSNNPDAVQLTNTSRAHAAFTVAQNTGAARVLTITIGCQTFTINQAEPALEILFRP